MSIGLIESLTPAQRRFVLLDNGVGAFVVNLMINGVIAWPAVSQSDPCADVGAKQYRRRHYRYCLPAPSDHVPDCYVDIALNN
jgi:hypothetical protein